MNWAHLGKGVTWEEDAQPFQGCLGTTCPCVEVGAGGTRGVPGSALLLLGALSAHPGWGEEEEEAAAAWASRGAASRAALCLGARQAPRPPGSAFPLGVSGLCPALPFSKGRGLPEEGKNVGVGVSLDAGAAPWCWSHGVGLPTTLSGPPYRSQPAGRLCRSGRWQLDGTRSQAR